MFATINEALDWLYAQPLGKSDSGLERVRTVLKELGNPHAAVPIIHVAGTNGKGSTVAFITQILNRHGLKVATFTSPHIYRFNERMMCDKQMISDTDVLLFLERLKQYSLTQFEYMTCLFFLYMAQEKTDVAVVEVGIGGLYDTTNVVDSILSVVTTIGMDHQTILGETLQAIAYQKAGIIKKNVPVVVGNIDATVVPVFRQVAREKDAPLYLFGKEYAPEGIKLGDDKCHTFIFDHHKYKATLKGRHQVNNATVALQVCQLYLAERFDAMLAQKAITETTWSGRFETIRTNPRIVVDGAHNQEGIKALLETMAQEFEEETAVILFGALSRKDYDEMIALLQGKYNVYVTAFNHPQSIQLDQMRLPIGVSAIPNWQTWLSLQQQTVVVTGSLYFISQVKAYIEQERT